MHGRVALSLVEQLKILCFACSYFLLRLEFEWATRAGSDPFNKIHCACGIPQLVNNVGTIMHIKNHYKCKYKHSFILLLKLPLNRARKQ